MFRSHPLQVLLLLACGVTAVNAKEPGAVLGAGGAVTCKEYVDLLKDPHKPQSIGVVLSWVQGYFSARNVAGRLTAEGTGKRLTVGGAMSVDALQAMLVDQCNDEDFFKSRPVLFAAEALYNKLQAKGL